MHAISPIRPMAGFLRRTVLMAILLALPLTGPAHADMPEPGRPHAVTGLTGNLTVRVQPDASAESIATLPADATDIIISGASHESDGAVWWQVVTAKGEGWVEARHLAPMAGEAGPDATFPLRCSGTEPFWSVAIANGSARFTTPDGAETFSAGKMEWARGSIRHVIVRLTQGTSSGLLTAIRATPSCSDGMSDTAFPYEGVLVKPDGAVYSGCCRRAG